MPSTEHGTVVTVNSGGSGSDGTLKPDGGGNDLDFVNPVRFQLTQGVGVTFLAITNPQTGETRAVINGMD